MEKCERTVNKPTELLEHLRRQFAYDAWANREVLASLSGGAHPDDRPRQLLAHILSAQRLWLERIRKQPQSVPVWPNFSLDQCEAQMSELASLWNEYLRHLSSSALSVNVAYKNSKGESWNSTVQDILTCPAALGVSSRADRQPSAGRRRAASLYGLYSRRTAKPD